MNVFTTAVTCMAALWWVKTTFPSRTKNTLEATSLPASTVLSTCAHDVDRDQIGIR